MRRRHFISFLGGAAMAPFAARAQQAPLPVIGFLSSASRDGYASIYAAFLKGLAESDHIDGRNVTVEQRWADGHYDRLPAMAADLVSRRVAVISANGPAALPAKAAAAGAIPIVFTVGFDPIALGLVSSLSRPSGNLTGVSILNTELAPKRLELIRELVPKAANIALLVNPANPNVETLTRSVHAAAAAFGLKVHVAQAKADHDFEPAFAHFRELRADALVIGNDPFLTTRSELLGALALRHALPAIYQYPEFATAGGLMSYGGSLTDTYHKAGFYTGRILRGDKPADLPVQQSTKLELIINLKTAKALGITVPLPLLGRADEVIE
jgi:putative tryptophan/tyrosine transport system substrate-binding protein